MRPLSEIIKELRQNRDLSKAEAARRLSKNAMKPISSQRLGQYEAGRQEPKIEFLEAWEKTFGEKLRDVQRQTNVSHGTINTTPVHKRSDNKEKPLGGDPEVYRTIVEGNTEYVLIPRKAMENAEIISKKQMDASIRNMDSIVTRMDNDSKLLQMIVAKFVETVEKTLQAPANPVHTQKRKDHS